MRRFVGGLALSALVHVGVVTHIEPSGPSTARRVAVRSAVALPLPMAPPASPTSPAEATELRVELVEISEPELARPAPSASRPRSPLAAPAAPTPEGAIVAGKPGSAAAAEGPSGELGQPAAPAGGALRMRGLGPPTLVVPDLSRIALAGEKPLAAPVTPSGELAPAGGGRMRSEHGTFIADVAPDGQVTLRDRPNLSVNFDLKPSKIRKGLGDSLANWWRDPYAQTRDPERQPLPSGVIDDEEEQRKRPKTVPIISGQFDITDWLMRMAGRDPYLAAKLRFLDRTRAERVEMAQEFRKELLRNVNVIVREHLARAWAEPAEPADKRRMLFELWDECLEVGGPDELEAAAAARAAILGFVRAHLPAGSVHAYPAAELDELNRQRSSRRPFAPYAP